MFEMTERNLENGGTRGLREPPFRSRRPSHHSTESVSTTFTTVPPCSSGPPASPCGSLWGATRGRRAPGGQASTGGQRGGGLGDSPPPTGASLTHVERQFLQTLTKVQQTMEKNEFRLAEQDRRDVIKSEWQQVALVVDRVLLLAFMVTTLSITMAILLHAPHSKEFILGLASGAGKVESAGVINAGNVSSASRFSADQAIRGGSSEDES